MKKPAILLALLFLVLGSFALDLPGIQTDEALFASVFNPKIPPVPVRLLIAHVPAMCFPYIGALKSALFALIWRVFEPSSASVHFPVVVLGALSIYLFARLLQRLNQAPWAALLLATDATYLMTIRSDWGPVALQHLFAIGGTLCLVRYAQTLHLKWVAAAGFTLGLGFWDKITFLWILFGLGVAILATPARKFIKPIPLSILALTFLAGCYPLLVFNYKTAGSSFQGDSTASLDTGFLRIKPNQVWTALGDANIFGVKYPHALPPVEPVTPIASIVSKVDYALHPYLPPLQAWLFVAALLAAPWLWKNGVYRFAFIALTAGYGYMFALKNAGQGFHHIVLLWPLPHILIAALPLRRWMLLLVVAANLLQINHFYAQLLRRETGSDWSDASVPLAQHVRNSPHNHIVLDWGIYDTLHLLNRGSDNLFMGPLQPDRNPTDFRYISHTPQLVILPIDSGHKHRLEPETTIPDSAGRPVFVIYRAVPVEGK